MKKEQVLRCQLSVWFPLFRHCTIRSIVLPLPQDVTDYLLDDGTLVVSGRNEAPSCSQTNESSDEEQDVQWSDDENVTTLTELFKKELQMLEQWKVDKNAGETQQAPEFPDFAAQVQEAINSLGGIVFPKLNWSAPRDAAWIALNGSLKCNNLSDIFLLLKSSDFIAHDLTRPFLHCTDDSPDPKIDTQLVLRKWCELIPGGEFRCFVKENKLIGVTQRDHTQYYDHVCRQEATILGSIVDFFKDKVQYKFPDEDFVFDVYRDSQGRVWIIDFNPFGEVTNSLLFTWEELTSGQNLSEGAPADLDGPVFRYITSEMTVQPSPYLSYRLPKDFVDLSRGEDAHKLIDFLKLTRNHGPESSDEED